MNKFGERLKELREEKGLTQDDLSKATNISQTSISHYEAKLKTPSIEVAITFCQFFKVSADYLLGLVD